MRHSRNGAFYFSFGKLKLELHILTQFGGSGAAATQLPISK
jgi:hypothetical protein